MRSGRSAAPATKRYVYRELGFGTTVGIVVAALAVGYLLASRASPLLHDRMLPWILGRTLGIGAYLLLVALVAVGIWVRHPWRISHPSLLHPATLLRSHVALAATTLAVALGHVVALATDSFAGVGWLGSAVPGLSGYRSAAVALGTVGLYGGLVVGISALLAGSLAQRVWLPIHRVALLLLAILWFHGVLAGADTPALRAMYALTGAAVLALAVSRRLAGRSAGEVGHRPGALRAAAASHQPPFLLADIDHDAGAWLPPANAS